MVKEESISLSLVVPCLNESENICLFLERFKEITSEITFPLEIIVVDGCSDDGTPEILKEEFKSLDRSRFKLILMEQRKGYGNDILEGLKEAGCESVSMGIQSGSEHIRTKLLHRRHSDELIITATVNEYYSFTQLIDVYSFTTISSGNSITPVSINTGDLGIACSLSGEIYEGMLIKVSNISIENIDEYENWTINDGSGQALVDDYFFDGDWPDVEPGDTFGSITGVILPL